MPAFAPDPPVAAALPSAEGLHFMLRALRHRNYRLYFTGQGLSLIGTWLTTTATSWLVLRLAPTSGLFTVAVLLGIVRFAAQIPMSALAPFAGVFVDRVNRHRILVITQSLSLLQSVALAIPTFTGQITVGYVIALSIFQGLINAFDAPARQAFVVELVEDRNDLPNAIALNSTMFNGARLIGPAVGGLIIATVGEAVCFTIDAVSYFAVIVALLMMRLRPRVLQPHPHGPWKDLREGFAYAAGFPPVRALLLIAALVSFMLSIYQTLLPLFADAVAAPGHGAAVFGFLGAAAGLGALAAAIYLSSRRTVAGLGQVIALAALLAGVALIGFAATRSLPMMYLTSIAAGFGLIVTFASCNTLLQTLVDDHLRGRLMGFYVVAVMGAAPLGSLAAGWLSNHLNESWAVALAGGSCIVGALLFFLNLPALRTIVRPIYIKKGILPEVATGLAHADRLHTADEG
jgi:MFS family permease